MSISAKFVDSLENYFGPWRGHGAKSEIVRWLSERNIPKPVLKEVYRELVETRTIEPVNTIGITDIDAALDRVYESGVMSTAPQLEGPADPDAMPKERAEQLLKEFREETLPKLCEAKNVKTAPVKDVSF